MKKFLFLFACAILCACDHTEPVTPSGGGGSTTANVDFVYQMSGLFTYKFTNTSTGCSSYKWDFGDGESSTTKNATHKYASEGAYTVTLTGTANGNKYRCSKKVSVKKPSIYVAGYKLYRIPYQNKYYKLIMYDDDWFGTDWGFQTVYSPLLDNSDLPYVKEFSNPKIMDKLDGDNYYNVQVKHSSNTTGDGTQCLLQKLYKTDILKYENEYILESDNKETKIGILMHYE